MGKKNPCFAGEAGKRTGPLLLSWKGRALLQTRLGGGAGAGEKDLTGRGLFPQGLPSLLPEIQRSRILLIDGLLWLVARYFVCAVPQLDDRLFELSLGSSAECKMRQALFTLGLGWGICFGLFFILGYRFFELARTPAHEKRCNLASHVSMSRPLLGVTAHSERSNSSESS